MAELRPGVVHQVNFGLKGDDGVGVVGGTLSDEDLLFWLRRLQVFLRLQRFRFDPPPAQALSTFEFSDGYTAVVRRWNSGGTLGRNDAMALIAPTALLSLPVVLGLDSGLDWTVAATERPFRAWRATELQDLGLDKAVALRGPAKQQPELLRRALARLFDAPESPLTIVGCPDEQRVPLLWGLHRLGAPRLLEHNQRRAWTFSTYEVEDADSITNLPAIVFLPDKPVGSAPSRRTFVDVRRDQDVTIGSARAAAQAVQRFLGDREEEPDRQQSRTADTPTLQVGRALFDVFNAAVVDGIRRARTSADLDAGMKELERATATPGDRAVLRDLLGADGYADLGRHVVWLRPRKEDQRALFDRLQSVVVGLDRSDLHDAEVSDFAVDVLGHGPPPVLGAAVLADLTTVHGTEAVTRAIAEHWLRAHPVEIPGPPDQLFLSYAREDEPAARAIVALLRAAGFTVWFDDGLQAGDEWWPEILRRIRASAAVVLVASEHARTSKPCELELRYVEDLGLPVVPVRVAEVRALRTWSVARRHLVDFTEADNEATARLVSGVFAAVRRWAPLPDPLPDEPAAPFAYLAELRRQLDRDDLSRQDQRRILDELREHLYAEPEEGVQDEICALLKRLADHPDARGLIIRDAVAALAEAADRRAAAR